jgi:hypothetical protein
MRLANRGPLTLYLSLILMGAAMAQNEKPPSNTMGDIINNQGIVTQGQIGDNYIIQHKAPKISFVGQLPSTTHADGSESRYLVFRIDGSSPANSLLVAVKKEDVVMPNNPIWPSFQVRPRGGGVLALSRGETDGYLWQRIQTPMLGEYILQTKVNSRDTKPNVNFEVN